MRYLVCTDCGTHYRLEVAPDGSVSCQQYRDDDRPMPGYSANASGVTCHCGTGGKDFYGEPVRRWSY